ncbi:helix-turn-helix transcriptional regulator [Listeria sp. FSL L7-1582]|uniref:AraC family transcriptional regulator n=1 Tax=Listeria portnoyi TaxID=2713504 RepID=UPI00164D6834|nr:helix-turn-helix domain-containing protein [Listeria portnoyi]MBC6309843.1 helix-turn-helix transcriptional regulator [Listeria portnoyi]
MQLFQISLEHPILYYKSGEFSAGVNWKHKCLHHDKDFEIIFCLADGLSLQIDGTPYTLQKNDCLVVPPATTISGGSPSQKKVSFYWLHFYAKWEMLEKNSESFQQILTTFSKREKTATLFNHCFLPNHFQLADANFTILLLNQLLNVTNNDYYTSKIYEQLTATILIELSNNFLKQNATKHNNPSKKMAQIKEWIRVNISNEMTITTVAEHFNLSADYLSRLFKKELGYNLRDYIIQLKISVAKVLLVQTQLPLKTIADLAYFNEDKYFIRMFKKKTSLTPNQYRKSYTGTRMNNPYIDPQIPVPQQIEKILDDL